MAGPYREGEISNCTPKSVQKRNMNDKELATHFKEHRSCPDCGSKKFFQGPRGGASQHTKCAECAECGHKFDVWDFYGVWFASRVD